ncbi:putative ammonia monooxygenase [Roseibium sp. TrichSKD4]|uniref:AbrB family transcriptional regulator n=1 Tax=Roseibium sp. TrichSKD4 TaxID=744980 RepID=UPI0001E56632|nr:AbrB family transcriptional regulator [Roseibium sp. TrichSKD4]EFO34262.1 putative ammonia monooxygenase [Roseibium sp. TrichSKD4]
MGIIFKKSLLKLGLTALVGGLGGAVFTWLGLPAGWLSGAMVAVALVTLGGFSTGVSTPVRNAVFVALGLVMGSGVQPDFLLRASEWPLSLAILAITVFGIACASYAVLRYAGRWPAETALYGAIPGALSFVMALAAERGADLGRIATTQTIRLLFLVAFLPMLIVGTSGLPAETANAVERVPLLTSLIGLFLCAVGGFFANRAGVPAGWMVGSFLISMIGNGSGYVPMGLPEQLQIPCYILLGSLIGSRFESITPRELVRLTGISVAAFAAGVLIAGLGASITSYWMDIPFGQALLAYAPGGLEVMTLLSFMLDLDPIYVAVHQIFRFVSMALLLPWISVVMLGRESRQPLS